MEFFLAHVVALALIGVELTSRAWKTRLLIATDQRATFRRTFVVNAYGDAAAAVTPGRLGGEPARFLGFRRAGIDAAAAAVALAVEKLIDGIAIVVVALGLSVGLGTRGLPGARAMIERLDSRAGPVIVGLLIVLVIGGAVAMRRYHHRHPQKVAEPLRKALVCLRQLPPSRIALVVAITFVGMTARVAILPVLCIGLAANIDIVAVVLGSFALLYSQLLMPMPSGIGGVEVGFALGFAPALSAGEIAALVVSWRLYTLFLGAGFGALLLGRALVVRRRAPLLLSVALLAMSVMATPASAQTARGSRTLAVGHWAYEYIGQLRPRGYLANLNPLVQPYRRLQVARGLQHVDPDTLPQPMAFWVSILRDELSPELERLAGGETTPWGIEGTFAIRTSTSQRHEPLRSLGGEGIWPRGTAAGWFENGPLAVESRLSSDLYFLDDPDGLDPGQRHVGRTDNSYASLVFPFGAAAIGRFKRNWSTLGTQGLMVSDLATAYPQLGFEGRAGRFSLHAFTGELESLRGAKRYLAAHRIDYRTGDLVVSLGESVLYATSGTGLQLRFLNPLEFFFFDHDNPPADATQNLMVTWQLWYRTGPVAVYVDALLDDVDVRPEDDPAPMRYAFTVGARVTSLTPAFGVEYQQVSAFAYRTGEFVDSYYFLERGLGVNFADYDRLTVTADVFPPLRGLRVTPLLQLLRQGEGDFRIPFPVSEDEFNASPALFLGVRQTTYRLGIRGRYQPVRFVWLGWDAGQNFVRNSLNVAGSNVSRFAAAAELGFTLELPLRAPR